MTTAAGEGRATDGVCPGCCTAFGTAPHSVLLSDLGEMGLMGGLLGG